MTRSMLLMDGAAATFGGTLRPPRGGVVFVRPGGSIPRNTAHLRPDSAFMRQVRETREIGVHPKYRNASDRRHCSICGPAITAEEWEQRQRDYRARMPMVRR